MFTGIIKAIGKIQKIEPQGGDLRLTIVSEELPWEEFAVGESISINGVCLTAVEFLRNGFVADVSGLSNVFYLSATAAFLAGGLALTRNHGAGRGP